MASIPLLLGWGLLVGLVYSAVGAAGGILAPVGPISVFGLENPNLVKPMAQALTLVTQLIAVPLYMRQCRVVHVLAVLLGVSGIVGAFIGSSLSSVWLSDMSLFKPVFALRVFFVAGQSALQLLRSSAEIDELSRTIVLLTPLSNMSNSGGQTCDIGVTHAHMSLHHLSASKRINDRLNYPKCKLAIYLAWLKYRIVVCISESGCYYLRLANCITSYPSANSR